MPAEKPTTFSSPEAVKTARNACVFHAGYDSDFKPKDDPEWCSCVEYCGPEDYDDWCPQCASGVVLAVISTEEMAYLTDRPWTDGGPTPEEAGGESILFRLPEGDLMRATWGYPGDGLPDGWVGDHGYRLTALDAPRWGFPSGWRPMPKANH